MFSSEFLSSCANETPSALETPKCQPSRAHLATPASLLKFSPFVLGGPQSAHPGVGAIAVLHAKRLTKQSGFSLSYSVQLRPNLAVSLFSEASQSTCPSFSHTQHPRTPVVPTTQPKSDQQFFIIFIYLYPLLLNIAIVPAVGSKWILIFILFQKCWTVLST